MSAPVVLVVDDDNDIRDALGETLKDEGYRVMSFQNGKEALDYLQHGGGADLILLDLMMPVMDGWTFRRELQKDPKLAAIPVIAITAAGPHQASTIQVEKVIPKPVRIDKLLDAVAEYASP